MAKASVTGTIGDEKVELNDAATETTLRNLKSAIEDLAKQKNTNARKAAENLDKLSKKTKQTTEDFDDLSAEIDSMSSAIPSIGGAFGALGSVVSGTVGIIGGLTTKAFDLAQGFFTFGNRLSDATAGIPLIGTLTQTIDTTVDEFRQLSQVGASFSNSLAEVRLTAARASLPLDEFSRVVQSNANLLAQFGGTVSTGARRFAEFSAGIREGELGTRLMGMGFSIEEINDRLAGYLEIQARQGRLESLQNQDLREGAAEYIEQLDALAKLTGQERSALEDSIQAQQEDAKIRAMGARITDETARAQFQANLALMDSLGGLGTGLKDLADGIPQTELGKALRVTVPEIQNIATAMGRGAISADQARRQLAQLAPRMREFVRGLNPAQIQAIQDSMPGLAQALDLGASLNRLNNSSQAENIAAQQEGIQTLTEFFTSFEQTVTSIRKSIEKTFLESPVFTLISDNLGRFADLFTADRVNGVVQEFEDEMARFNTWFDGVIQDVENRGLWPALKTAISDIFSEIKGFLFGTTEKEFQIGLRNGKPVITDVIEREVPGIFEKAFTGLSDWYDNSGLKDTFEQMANDIAKSIKRALVGGLSPEEQRTKQALESRLDYLENDVPSAGGAAIPIPADPELRKERGDILQQLKTLEEKEEGILGFLGKAVIRNEGSASIENFGVGSPAMLHGREAVLTEEQLFRMANGVFNQGALQNVSAQSSLVDQISRLNRNAFEKGALQNVSAQSSLVDKISRLNRNAFEEGASQNETLVDQISRLNRNAFEEGVSRNASAQSSLVDQISRLNRNAFEEGASQSASAQSSLVDQISRLNRNAFEEGVSRNASAQSSLVDQISRLNRNAFEEGASQSASAQSSLVDQISRLHRNAFEEGATRTTKIDIANLSNYTDSVKHLTNEMKTVSEKLSNLENFTPQTVETTEQINNRDSEQLQALNSTMNKIYTELVQSNDMSNKQLKATKGLSGNLI